jgi:hypothetical protein
MRRLEVNDITADLANRSDDDLRFYLAHHHWPEDGQIPRSVGPEDGSEELDGTARSQSLKWSAAESRRLGVR